MVDRRPDSARLYRKWRSGAPRSGQPADALDRFSTAAQAVPKNLSRILMRFHSARHARGFYDWERNARLVRFNRPSQRLFPTRLDRRAPL